MFDNNLGTYIYTKGAIDNSRQDHQKTKMRRSVTKGIQGDYIDQMLSLPGVSA